jgi:phage shock protein PspC (stress-responsive transcriptional regulator)
MLRRPHDGRLIAGVAAGAADYFGIDVTIVRIVLVVLALFGGAGVPLYLAAWLLVPDEGSDVSAAEELLDQFRSR